MTMPNPWIILGVLVAFLAFGTGAYFKGRAGGKADVYAEWELSKSAAVEKKLDVKGAQDEIQNAPVDVGVTTRRMRAGTF